MKTFSPEKTFFFPNFFSNNQNFPFFAKRDIINRSEKSFLGKGTI